MSSCSDTQYFATPDRLTLYILAQVRRQGLFSEQYSYTSAMRECTEHVCADSDSFTPREERAGAVLQRSSRGFFSSAWEILLILTPNHIRCKAPSELYRVRPRYLPMAAQERATSLCGGGWRGGRHSGIIRGSYSCQQDNLVTFWRSLVKSRKTLADDQQWQRAHQQINRLVPDTQGQRRPKIGATVHGGWVHNSMLTKPTHLHVQRLPRNPFFLTTYWWVFKDDLIGFQSAMQKINTHSLSLTIGVWGVIKTTWKLYTKCTYTPFYLFANSLFLST